MRILTVIMAALLAGPDPTVAGVTATRPAEAAPFLAVTDAEFDRLLKALGHPQFSVREEATTQLCRLEPRYLATLAQRYRAQGDYEAKRRIRFVLESVFYRSQIMGRNGFLGIRIAREVLSSLTDPATGGAIRGVYVVEALEGLPARRAGLRANDVIIAVDGQPLPDDPSSQGFQEAIANRAPGCVVELRVLRPTAGPRRVELALGDDAAGAKVGASFEPPPLGVRFGPRVVKVAPGSPADAAGLRVNDVITSINGRPVTTPAGYLTIEQALAAARQGHRYTLGVLAAEEATVSATLGSRPAKYLEPADKAEAQADFIRWWQEQGGEWLLLPAYGPGAADLPGEADAPDFPMPETLVIP